MLNTIVDTENSHCVCCFWRRGSNE